MILEKIVRRNSTIIFFKENDVVYVKKSYHNTYDISEEVMAYNRLQEIIRPKENIRTAQIKEINDDSIILEFIDGIPLNAINNTTFQVLLSFKRNLNDLFYRCHISSFKFDSDTLNLIYSKEKNEIVIIDPVCEKNDIPYFTFVVFAISIIKSFTKKFNPLFIKKTFHLFNAYITDFNNSYAQDLNVLKKSFLLYIQKIINWNRTYNKQESLPTYLFRCFVIIPFWYIVDGALRVYFLLKTATSFSSKMS